MKTVCRQDGTQVELSDEEAANWIKRGLATEPPTAGLRADIKGAVHGGSDAAPCQGGSKKNQLSMKGN